MLWTIFLLPSRFKNSDRNIVELNEVLSLKNVGCCGMIVRLGFSKHGVWQEVGLRVWQMCMQKLESVVMNLRHGETQGLDLRSKKLNCNTFPFFDLKKIYIITNN